MTCCSRSRCVLSLEWLCAEQWWQEWQSQSPQDYFIFFLFLPPCCFKQQSFICQACWGKCSHVGSAKGTHQNRLDEGNGPQPVKAKSLPNFWEIRFFNLAPKWTLNILQWDHTQPGHPWHLGNSAFPALSGAGFGCETKIGRPIKGSLINFCFSLIAFCLHYGQISRVSRHLAWDSQLDSQKLKFPLQVKEKHIQLLHQQLIPSCANNWKLAAEK